MAVAVVGEADDISEQDGHFLKSSRCNPAGGLQLRYGRCWEDRAQGSIELAPLCLDLGQVRTFAVAQPLTIEGGADAGAQDHLVEGLWKIVVRPELDAARNAVDLAHGRD